MTRIFLIRHAEAEGNIFRRAHGHYNGLITQKGYKQIERLHERFEDEHIDVIYSSDLARAQTTATALSEPRGLPIIPTEKLREVGVGVWEDDAWGDIEHLYPEMNDKFNSDPASWCVEGSETYDNVKSRMFSFITETAKSHDGETIALFSHGFAIRSLMCLLNDIPSCETSKVPYYDNTAVTLLIYDNNELTIDYCGCNSHLSERQSTLAQQTWWQPLERRRSENIRYMPLDEVASADLINTFKVDVEEHMQADLQYAALIVDEPVGVLGLDTKKDRGEGIGWISYIHVASAHRGKSFTTQLLGLAISVFRKLKRERLRIELPSDSPGVSFLQRFDFEVVDTAGNLITMEKNIKNSM